MANTVSNATPAQRVALVRAYMNELERICNENHGGDWEKMPKDASKLRINWIALAKKARIQTTGAGAAALVRHAVADDDLMEQVGV